MGRPRRGPSEGMTMSEDSDHERPRHRKWLFLGRVFEICFIGIALGLTAYVTTSPNVTGWPPESGARGTLGFLGAATGLGSISAVISLFVLCFKYHTHDLAFSKNSYEYKGFNMAFVYVGVASAALSLGAASYTIINMGDSGLRCTAGSMKSHQFCTMLMAIVVLTIIGAFVALVSAGFEWRRIRHWAHVLEQYERVATRR